MTVERSVAELRQDAASVLRLVDLTGTFLASSEFESRYRSGDFTLVTAFDVNTKIEHSKDILLCWVRHRVWSLVATDGVDIPDAPEDVPQELINEHLAWRGESEWIAQYSVTGEADLTKIEPSVLSAFGMIMAPPTIHPYAREHFQSHVSKSPYPAFTLPHLTPLSQMPDDELIEIDDA